MLKTIGKLFRNYKPLLFFGVLAVILTILAAAFFIPVFIKYLNTGQVPNLPTLLVCGFTVIAAIQSFFSGMILETINQKNRQDFEMELVRIRERRMTLVEEK